MKLTTTFIVLMIATVGYAQSGKVKYGPKAKNERAWITQTQNTESDSQEFSKTMGAIAKNNHTWLKNGTSLNTTANQADDSVERMTGPNAKNHQVYLSLKKTKSESISDQDMVQTASKN